MCREIQVNTWVWKKLELDEENTTAILMTNLPFILASIPPASRRPEWLYVMHSMFRGILASRRILMDGSTWSYSDGADSIIIGNVSISVRRFASRTHAF